MAPNKTGINIRVTGPLFKPAAPQEIIEATNTGLLDLVQFEGANKTGEQLKPGRGRVTGQLQRAIFGGASIIADLVAQYDAGEVKRGANLVYATWIEGISTRNSPVTSFEGYGMFKNTREKIEGNTPLFEKYIGESIVKAYE